MGKGFGGAIFDVDGVLVDSPHERAWREAFQEMMEGEWSDVRDQTTYSPEKFTPQVYQQVMSGKPRMEGARAVIEYFEVPDPERRTEEYADRKQRMVVELIEAGEFEAYPDALRFVLAVRNAGIPTAAASSSKNAGLFLRQIRLDTFAGGGGALRRERRDDHLGGGAAQEVAHARAELDVERRRLGREDPMDPIPVGRRPAETADRAGRSDEEMGRRCARVRSGKGRRGRKATTGRVPRRSGRGGTVSVACRVRALSACHTTET